MDKGLITSPKIEKVAVVGANFSIFKKRNGRKVNLRPFCMKYRSGLPLKLLAYREEAKEAACVDEEDVGALWN